MKITFYGASSRLLDEKYIKAVEDLGEALAKRGHELVFGGGATGLMGAAVRGVKKAGGRATGIIPEFFKETHFEQLFKDSDEIIWTADMYSRKQLLSSLADGFVIAPGGVGTYDEFFGVLTDKQLLRHRKPIALYNIDGFYDDLVKFIDGAIEKKYINQNCKELFRVFGGTDGLFEYLESDDNGLIGKDFKNIQ